MKIKCKLLKPGAKLPEYQTKGAAAMDLCACLDEPVMLYSGRRTVIPTGIAMSIPEGFEGQIRSRSGLASYDGVYILNSPGTIDSDYTGEIKVILGNSNRDFHDFLILPGMRIAQLVIAPIVKAELEVVDSLLETERGSGGFGSTGI
jgi:dUTP pyrophosphatase